MAVPEEMPVEKFSAWGIKSNVEKWGLRSFKIKESFKERRSFGIKELYKEKIGNESIEGVKNKFTWPKSNWESWLISQFKSVSFIINNITSIVAHAKHDRVVNNISKLSNHLITYKPNT